MKEKDLHLRTEFSVGDKIILTEKFQYDVFLGKNKIFVKHVTFKPGTILKISVIYKKYVLANVSGTNFYSANIYDNTYFFEKTAVLYPSEFESYTDTKDLVWEECSIKESIKLKNFLC